MVKLLNISPGSLYNYIPDLREDLPGHPGHNADTLCADLYRLVFLLGASNSEELFGEPTP